MDYHFKYLNIGRYTLNQQRMNYSLMRISFNKIISNSLFLAKIKLLPYYSNKKTITFYIP